MNVRVRSLKKDLPLIILQIQGIGVHEILHVQLINMFSSRTMLFDLHFLHVPIVMQTKHLRIKRMRSKRCE